MDVTVFELGSDLGGLWLYENDNGRSPAYRSLHINSEARVTGYRDFPFPEDTLRLVRRRQIPHPQSIIPTPLIDWYK